MSKPIRHPFVALEHRVIDSPAYADLSFSARNLLVLIARQLTRDNNGHLQATFAWCSKYGIGSEHTLRGALAELTAHGFIYKTRSHGANGAWARYAVTWLPIVKRDGLFLAGFVSCAWRGWTPPSEKSTRQILLDQSSRKCSFTPEIPAESAGSATAETADYESCCHGSSASAPRKTMRALPAAPPRAWMPAYLANLERVGLAGRQCFQIPEGVTLQ